MADRVGQQLGNYHLVRLLGQGGFAEVYLGEHLHLGTQAAIKVLHTRLARDDVDKFRTEARTIARLVHPHIVRVFDFGIEGETPFLVMDYAPNGTVRKRHPKGVLLPLPTILSYIKQIADALQYAHDEHFIHRDVKPENLLIGRRQEILLSDFGIALIAQTSRSQSMQDVAGTASYMAPEQFQGKPRPASDQYALAIMVYEWLTGTCPFHGSFTEIASQHLFVPPPSLREKMSTISPEVEQVVMTALAKDPKQRFGSVQAFATALEQAWQTGQARGTAPTVLGTPLIPPALPTRETPPSSFAPTHQASSDKGIAPTMPVVSTPESTPVPATSVPKAVSTPPVPEPLVRRENMNVITSTQVSPRYWWLLGVRGLLAVLFGLAALVWPRATLLVLVLLFGAYALVDGVMAVIVSLQERSVFARWWVLLLEGLTGIAAGVLAFVWPGITLLVLLYLIASWAVVRGAFEIAAAFSGQLPVAREWTLALAGILSVLLGVLVAILRGVGLLYPLGALSWIEVYAIVFGVLLLIRAFQFKTASTA